MKHRSRVFVIALSAVLAASRPGNAQWIMHFSHSKFTAALCQNDLAQAKANIDQETDVNAVREKGTTLLHAAAYWGNMDVCELLLAKGAKPDLADKEGRTALHYSVIFNECEMGNPVNESEYIETLRRGKESVCNLLIGKGADVKARDVDGNTPLHWAVGFWPHCLDTQEVTRGFCRLLLAKGADVNATNSTGATALHRAAGHNGDTIGTCDLLITGGANVNAGDRQGSTPLFFAARSGLTNKCAFLIRKGADINARDAKARTPLHEAVDNSQKETCGLLLASGKVEQTAIAGLARGPAEPNGPPEYADLQRAAAAALSGLAAAPER